MWLNFARPALKPLTPPLRRPPPRRLTIEDDSASEIAASSGWKAESVRAHFSIVCWRGHDSVALLIKKEEVRELLRTIDALRESVADASKGGGDAMDDD